MQLRLDDQNSLDQHMKLLFTKSFFFVCLSNTCNLNYYHHHLPLPAWACATCCYYTGQYSSMFHFKTSILVSAFQEYQYWVALTLTSITTSPSHWLSQIPSYWLSRRFSPFHRRSPAYWFPLSHLSSQWLSYIQTFMLPNMIFAWFEHVLRLNHFNEFLFTPCSFEWVTTGSVAHLNQ